jgi:hypothetical protein
MAIGRNDVNQKADQAMANPRPRRTRAVIAAPFRMPTEYQQPRSPEAFVQGQSMKILQRVKFYDSH